MLTSWANTIVIGAFGLGLGGVCSLVRHFTPKALEDAIHTNREGEGLWEGTMRRNEEQQAVIRSAEARPMRLAEWRFSH